MQRLMKSRHRDPEELIGWLEDALDRSSPVSRHPDAEWSESDAALLAYEGVDVTELRPGEPDTVAAGYRRYLGILASGLSVAAAADRLGVSGSRIRQVLSRRQLYGVRPRSRAWVIPEWQFAGAHQLTPGIEAVNRSLPDDCNPLTIAGFLTTPQPELEIDGTVLSPLDWLREGRTPQPVVALARDL